MKSTVVQTQYDRITSTIKKKTSQKLKKLVPPRKRSAFINDAIAKELKRIEFQQFLKEYEKQDPIFSNNVKINRIPERPIQTFDF